MKTSLISCLALLLAAIQSSIASPAAFSLDVSLSGPEGDPVVISMPNLALDYESFVDLSLPTPTGVLAANFRFHLDEQYVEVNIFDPALVTPLEKGTHGAKVAEAGIAFEYGKETTIVTSDFGAISITLTPPDNRKATDGKTKRPRTREVGALPAEDLAKIEYEAGYNPQLRQSVFIRAYNPTEWDIDEVFLRVTIPKSEDFSGMDRVYEINGLDLHPRSDISRGKDVFFDPGIPEDAEIKVTLESASGTKYE